jgi:hypothetical protein
MDEKKLSEIEAYKNECRTKLHYLLKRREKYFLMEGVQRSIYQVEFEKVQKEIIKLKLYLDIYEDDLDFFVIKFNYMQLGSDEKYKTIKETQSKNEIRVLRQMYTPEEEEAVFVCQVKSAITDIWLRELYDMQYLRRQGLIDCPWPTKLEGGK